MLEGRAALLISKSKPKMCGEVSALSHSDTVPLNNDSSICIPLSPPPLSLLTHIYINLDNYLSHDRLSQHRSLEGAPALPLSLLCPALL